MSDFSTNNFKTRIILKIEKKQYDNSGGVK